MAATPVAVTKITRTGIAPAAFVDSDNVNGNTAANDGRTWLELSNTDTGSHTVAVTVAREVDGQAVTPVSHSIAAGAQLRLGPFPIEDYGNFLTVTTDNALLKIAAYNLDE